MERKLSTLRCRTNKCLHLNLNAPRRTLTFQSFNWLNNKGRKSQLKAVINAAQLPSWKSVADNIRSSMKQLAFVGALGEYRVHSKNENRRVENLNNSNELVSLKSSTKANTSVLSGAVENLENVSSRDTTSKDGAVEMNIQARQMSNKSQTSNSDSKKSATPQEESSSSKMLSTLMTAQQQLWRLYIAPRAEQALAQTESKATAASSLATKSPAASASINWPTALKIANASSKSALVAKGQPSTAAIRDAKKVAIHREVMSRESADRKTKGLVLSLKSASSADTKLRRLEELNSHLKQHPESRSAAEGVQATLLRLKHSSEAHSEQMELTCEMLAILGYVDPPRGRGVRILSLDGGGTRGLISIEVLRNLEKVCKAPLHELFDYVCGVSTGSLLAVMVAVFNVQLDECERVYKEFSRQMFSRNIVMGASTLLMSHAFYDASIWEKILVENLTERSFLETTRQPGCPKVSALSSVMNLPRIKNFIFRNYSYPMGVASQFPGSFSYRLWQAVRASSAAPGYYEEMKLDGYVHQDGGILTNNPTGVAIHESKLLWPREHLQCVVSIGTGRYEPTGTQGTPVNYGSLKQKINKLVQSATDTEAIHTALNDLLPPATYYRFNPYMSEDYHLDEVDAKRWDQMVQDTQLYCRKNEAKLSAACQRLVQPRMPQQKALDWLVEQRKMIG